MPFLFNTLILLMADNGPFIHYGPRGMVETLYTGGKGDFTEGGVRVPCIASWPGTIEPGQIVGDILHVTDLFTTFARLGGAMEYIPRDRVIDGVVGAKFMQTLRELLEDPEQLLG